MVFYIVYLSYIVFGVKVGIRVVIGVELRKGFSLLVIVLGGVDLRV